MNVIYDIETYPNVFTFTALIEGIDISVCFEFSQYVDQLDEMFKFFRMLRDNNARMVGYNNVSFDYPVIHYIIESRSTITPEKIYKKAMSLINDDNNWRGQVRPSDCFIPQVDLYLINHFDNAAKRTSLKALEVMMRSRSIEELPFPVGERLSEIQIPILKEYNLHDVKETYKFYQHCKHMIEFREQLSEKYNKPFINYNDVKIGTTIFQIELEKAGIQLYNFDNRGRTPRQTKRDKIQLKDAILDWIKFEKPEFRYVLEWLKGQTITETKGVFKDLVATVDGFTYTFGLGGIHGSVESKVVEADDDMMILDIDVESYYPSTAIAQRFYPEHLGERFADIYAGLKSERKKYNKGTPENAAYKLALNGTYGQSNSQFSVFYDPLFTMRITLNGQLLLCMLAEQLTMRVNGLSMIQANTDGITFTLPRKEIESVRKIIKSWEDKTKLNMEETEYKSMYIRDVNSYIAVKLDGSIKRIGAYAYETPLENPNTREVQWHKDPSQLIVPKAAEQHLVYGKSIREVVYNHEDIMDFMLRAKVPRSSKLVQQFEGGDEEQVNNITRYIITKSGVKLFKLMPPTKKQLSEGKTDWRRFSIAKGRLVTVCNDLSKVDLNSIDIDYDYYINEVEKLTLGLN